MCSFSNINGVHHASTYERPLNYENWSQGLFDDYFVCLRLSIKVTVKPTQWCISISLLLRPLVHERPLLSEPIV